VVDSIRRVRNRIKSFLLYAEVDEPVGLRLWTRGSVEELKVIDLPQESRWHLDSLLREMSFHEADLKVITKQLAKLTQGDDHKEVIDCLKSVPGVGPVVATTFRFELFRPERFKRAEEVVGYLGLAPMVSQSGEGKNSRLKSLLVEAAWTWRVKDPWADAFYKRLLSKTGITQKAIIALARKLAIILWRLSIERRYYRPGFMAA